MRDHRIGSASQASRDRSTRFLMRRSFWISTRSTVRSMTAPVRTAAASSAMLKETSSAALPEAVLLEHRLLYVLLDVVLFFRYLGLLKLRWRTGLSVPWDGYLGPEISPRGLRWGFLFISNSCLPRRPEVVRSHLADPLRNSTASPFTLELIGKLQQIATSSPGEATKNPVPVRGWTPVRRRGRIQSSNPHGVVSHTESVRHLLQGDPRSHQPVGGLNEVHGCVSSTVDNPAGREQYC